MNLMDLLVRVGVKDDASGKIDGISNSIVGKLKGAAAMIGGIVGVTSVAAFGKAIIDTGMQFDESMAGLAATMGTTVDQIGELRDFAQEMGRTTAFSASEAAEGLNYMALAGYDAETQMEMLPTVLNLAAAGSMDLAAASDMVTDAQSALGLTTEETSAMVDQMATAASTTNTSVAQLGEAILTVGGTAQYMSGGTEALSTALGILADNGIKGAEGGTHLRNIILSLANPTDDARAALEELGVQVFDSEGNMRDFADIFPELEAAMDGMTDEQRMQALATIFNKTDLSSVNALLGTTTERWDEVGQAISDSAGSAEEMANTRLDSLAGDVTLMKSAFEGLMISIFDKVSPALRALVEGATEGLGVLAGVIGGDEEAFNQLATQMGPVGAAIADVITQFSALGETWGPLVGAAMEQLGPVFEYLLSVFIEFIAFVGFIANAVGEAIPVVVEWFQQLPANIGAAIDSVVAWFTSLPDRAYAALQDLHARAQAWGDSMGAKARETGMNFVNGVVSFFQSLPSRVAGFLAGIIATVTSWAATMGARARAAATNFANNLISTIQSLPSRVASIGSQIVQGIANGIRNAAGSVVSALRGVVDGAINSIKARLGIASPSKLFRDEVGQWIPEGVAEGIYKTGDAIQSAYDDVMGDFSFGSAVSGDGIRQAASAGLTIVFDGLSVVVNQEDAMFDACVNFAVAMAGRA